MPAVEWENEPHSIWTTNAYETSDCGPWVKGSLSNFEMSPLEFLDQITRHKTSPRQDKNFSKNLTQDKTQDKTGWPKTNPRQDKYKKFLSWVLSWVTHDKGILYFSCLGFVLGHFVLSCMPSNIFVLSWACHGFVLGLRPKNNDQLFPQQIWISMICS